MRCLKIIFFLNLVSALFFATSINKSGDINGNEVWCKSTLGLPNESIADTFRITGTINISTGDILNIDSGVVVFFTNGDYYFNITGSGRLLAIGNSTDSVRFTAEQSTGWQGIRFSSMSGAADSSIIDYCIIEYGKADGSDPFNRGGGIYIAGGSSARFSKIRISNCRISNNESTNDGGGIYCEYTNLLISNNLIKSNYAGNSGGGLSVSYYSAPTILNNIISNNSASNRAGGIYFLWVENSANAINNIISNNSAKEGGALYFYQSHNTLTNNIICNNTAQYGNALYFWTGSPTFINNTIVNNYASTQGGAGMTTYNSDPNFKNCIIYGNRCQYSSGGHQINLTTDLNDPNFYYCDVEGGMAAFKGVGTYTGNYEKNIDKNPNFISPSGGTGTGYNGLTANWRLQDTSPCINVGSLNLDGLPTRDKDGNPRIYGKRVDIGAYENQNVYDLKLNLKVFLQGAYR